MDWTRFRTCKIESSFSYWHFWHVGKVFSKFKLEIPVANSRPIPSISRMRRSRLSSSWLGMTPFKMELGVRGFQVSPRRKWIFISQKLGDEWIMITRLSFFGVREVLTSPFMANILQEYQFLLLLVDLVLTCFPPHLAQKTQVVQICGFEAASHGWPKKKMKHPRFDWHWRHGESHQETWRIIKNHQDIDDVVHTSSPNHKPPKYVGTQHEQIPSPVQPNFCRPIATQIVHAWRMKLHFPKEIKKKKRYVTCEDTFEL